MSAIKRFDTAITYVPYFDHNDDNIITDQVVRNAMKNSTGKYRPCAILGTKGDHIAIAQIRSSDSPHRMEIKDTDSAHMNKASFITLAKEDILYIPKENARFIKPVGHLSDQDIANYQKAFYEYNVALHSPNHKTQEQTFAPIVEANQAHPNLER